MGIYIYIYIYSVNQMSCRMRLQSNFYHRAVFNNNQISSICPLIPLQQWVK